jgi:acyl carrier protein
MEVSLEQIREIFAREVDKKVDVKNIDSHASLSDEGVDSLDSASVFLALEDEFNVKFTDDDIAKLDTLNKIKAFIESKKSA